MQIHSAFTSRHHHFDDTFGNMRLEPGHRTRGGGQRAAIVLQMNALIELLGKPPEDAEIDSLFHHTPPTALIIQQAMLYMAAQQYLAGRGILAPEHVSLICTDPDPAFAWCKPSIAHTYWDSHPLIKHVCRWVDNVARGRSDLRQTATPTQFVEGGTIGPVPKA